MPEVKKLGLGVKAAAVSAPLNVDATVPELITRLDRAEAQIKEHGITLNNHYVALVNLTQVVERISSLFRGPQDED